MRLAAATMLSSSRPAMDGALGQRYNVRTVPSTGWWWRWQIIERTAGRIVYRPAITQVYPSINRRGGTNPMLPDKREILPNIYPEIVYEDAPAALEWLARVFGFELGEVVEGPNGIVAHAEMHLGPGTIMPKSVGDEPFGMSPRQLGGVSQSIFVAVDDPDAHYRRTRARRSSWNPLIRRSERAITQHVISRAMCGIRHVLAARSTRVGGQISEPLVALSPPRVVS